MELITYIGVIVGEYENYFMQSNNTVYTLATAQFNENSFPRSVQLSKVHRNQNPLPTQEGDDDYNIPDHTPSSSNKRLEPWHIMLERKLSPPIA